MPSGYSNTTTGGEGSTVIQIGGSRCVVPTLTDKFQQVYKTTVEKTISMGRRLSLGLESIQDAAARKKLTFNYN